MPGEEARKVFNDAQTLLKNIMNDKLLQCRGVVGFYRAQSVGDDIELYDENGAVIDTLFGIRQQVHRPVYLPEPDTFIPEFMILGNPV